MANDPERGLGSAGSLSAEQLMNAGAIIGQGMEMGLDDQTIAAALATALMESGLRNLDYGDRDSVGLFQQRPSQGWGTPAQINDPKYAARKFFEAYMKATGSTVVERIANTQRPAKEHRGKYANHFETAQAAFEKVTGTTAPVLRSAPKAAQGEPRSLGSAPTTPPPSDGGGGTVIVQTAASPTETRPDITADTPPEEVEEYIRTYYAAVAPFLGRAEFKMILYAAAINDWDERKLDAAIEQTQYWKTTTPQHRALDALLGSDRKGAEQVIDSAKGIVSDLFSTNGVTLDDTKTGDLAKQALKGGIIGFNQAGQVFVSNQDRLNEMLAFGLNARPQGDALTGDIGASADDLTAIARSDFLLPITRREAEDWSVKILQGSATAEAFRSEMSRRAGERYGWLGLSEGQTTASRFDGAVAVLADIFETDPDEIDLLDPRWNWVVESTDPNTGQRFSPGLGDVARQARNEVVKMPHAERPDWYKGQDARLASDLARSLGMVV